MCYLNIYTSVPFHATHQTYLVPTTWEVLGRAGDAALDQFRAEMHLSTLADGCENRGIQDSEG